MNLDISMAKAPIRHLNVLWPVVNMILDEIL